MMGALLLDLDRALVVAALVLLLLAGGWYTLQPLLWARLRRRGLARERAALATPLPEDPLLPHVLVQLPTFNELSVMRRSAEAAAALDWPREKLHLQLLDDSTDASAALAREIAAELRARGLDVDLLQRSDRVGFKAGALQAGLARAGHEFVALFDADFVPAPDFLRRAMPAMLADPGLAFVTARWDHLNAEANTLTRVQQRLNDAFFGMAQPVCSWAGYLLPFTGTCGIWRRAAIDAAGGWHWDTLSEDFDLAYRAQFRGWRAMHLLTLGVPGELPQGLDAWRRQQDRWARGFAQVARKHFLPLWRSGETLASKLATSLQMAGALLGPAVLVAVLAGLPLILLGAFDLPLLLLAVLAAAQLIGMGFVVLVMGQVHLRRASFRSEAGRTLMCLAAYLYSQLWALPGMLLARRHEAAVFVATPKQGSGVLPARRGAAEDR